MKALLLALCALLAACSAPMPEEPTTLSISADLDPAWQEAFAVAAAEWQAHGAVIDVEIVPRSEANVLAADGHCSPGKFACAFPRATGGRVYVTTDYPAHVPMHLTALHELGHWLGGNGHVEGPAVMQENYSSDQPTELTAADVGHCL